MNPIHTVQSNLSKNHFNNIFHLRLSICNGLLPSGVTHQNPIHINFLPMRVTCNTHLIFLDLIPWRRVQVMKLLIMQFSPTSLHFISLQSKYSRNLISNTLSLCSCLTIRDQVSHRHRTTAKL
jgi:hypothetical protein